MQGLEERDTKSNIHVFRVHFTADPVKRDDVWQVDAAAGMPGGREGKAWRREMNIDWTVGSGLPVYADEFVRDWHVAKKQLLAYPNIPLYRGWDLGPTHNFPACAICQFDPLGRLCVLDEVVSYNGREEPKACAIDLFAENVQLISNQDYPGAEWIDYSDPAGWAKSMTDSRSAVMILNEKRIYPRKGPVTFTQRKNAMNQRLTRSVHGQPAILISPNCSMLIEGLAGTYRYEEIGETGRYKPDVEKNAWSHPMNALEYVVGGLYVPDEMDNRDKPRKQPKRDRVTGY